MVSVKTTSSLRLDTRSGLPVEKTSLVLGGRGCGDIMGKDTQCRLAWALWLTFLVGNFESTSPWGY